MAERESIGIFDSGVGGLTVFRRVSECLPHEPVLYFGDTARVPYGTKSADTVIRYARSCVNILLERGIKFLIIACNTASAFALETLQEDLDIPVLGVVEPGAAAAAAATRNGRIGVIGTAGTIASGMYPLRIRSQAPDVEVFAKACPLLVPLAEEGWISGEVPSLTVRTYLGDLLEKDIDTLVLGCTHYPLLKETIAQEAGPGIRLIDSAEATATVVQEVVQRLGMSDCGDGKPEHRFLVSDAPENFARIGRRFLGYEIGHVEWVDF